MFDKALFLVKNASIQMYYIQYNYYTNNNFIFLQIVLVRNKRNCIFAPLLAEDFAIEVKQKNLKRFKIY